MDNQPNGQGVRTLLWLAGVVAFLLTIFGAGYVSLDARKADKDAVAEMAKDIRELRTYFLGPKR